MQFICANTRSGLQIGILVLWNSGFYFKLCHHLCGLHGNGWEVGGGAAGGGPLAWVILLGLNLQRARPPRPCAQAHRSVEQVKGEGAGTQEQRPVPHCHPLSPVEAIHHAASRHSWMGQLPPQGIFSFSGCPRRTWWLSFQSYFLLRPLMHKFWILRGHLHLGPFWSFFFIVVGGGMQTRDHPGWSLRSCPQQNGSFEVRFLSAKTCHAFESPLSWWRRKSEQAHQAACCLCESSGPAPFPSDVMVWAPGSQWNWRHIVLACMHHPARGTARVTDIFPEPQVKSGYVQSWWRQAACVLQDSRWDLVTQMSS